ncbi:MAG: hypothetical protein IPH13_05545 [Planctomycetes bacterium]|nr:hypothetical protein [Planctomycetota bacterium]MCC7172449.1 hypothetical protein [Planctomycetota bacterium]
MNLASILVLCVGASSLAFSAAANAEVTAVQKGTKLVILGDSINDVIHVEGGGALGKVKVDQGTTPSLVGSFVGVRDITIETGDGNDAVNVSGIEIPGSLKAKLGKGADFLRIDDLHANGTTNRSPFIGGNVDASLGDELGDTFQCEIALATNVVTIGGNLSIRGASNLSIFGGGSSSNTGDRDIYVAKNLSIRAQLAGAMALDDVNVGGTTKFVLGGAADFLEIEDSLFVRGVAMKLGDGNDHVHFISDIECNATLAIDGGGGQDVVEAITNVTVLGKSTIQSVEDPL